MLLWHRDGRTPGERHVALMAEQGMACHVYGYQRRRTSCLHADTRTGEAHLVRDAWCDKVLVTGNQQLVLTLRGQHALMGKNVAEEVGIECDASVYGHSGAPAGGAVPAML